MQVDVAVADIERDGDTFILLLKLRTGPINYGLSLVASSRPSGVVDQKQDTLADWSK